jgi:hypothetical protein
MPVFMVTKVPSMKDIFQANVAALVFLLIILYNIKMDLIEIVYLGVGRIRVPYDRVQ